MISELLELNINAKFRIAVLAACAVGHFVFEVPRYAKAEDVKPVQQEDCTKVKGYGKDALCAIKQIRKLREERKRAEQQIKKANEQIMHNNLATACMDKVGVEIDAAKKRGPVSKEQKKRFKRQLLACDKL